MQEIYMCDWCGKILMSKGLCREHEEQHRKISNLQIEGADYSKYEEPQTYPTYVHVWDKTGGPIVTYKRAEAQTGVQEDES